ncbi:MAG: RnfH family protein [Methylococcaceae bacterium]|nr:MAG: RnfH family protein [Methylococcaceae bacterium]
MTDTRIKVEVAYAKPAEQVILSVMLETDATVEAAIHASGILQRFPEIDLAQAKVGIFSKPCGLDHVPRPNERIEIYRPLIADPKEARRHRAAKSV